MLIDLNDAAPIHRSYGKNGQTTVRQVGLNYYPPEGGAPATARLTLFGPRAGFAAAEMSPADLARVAVGILHYLRTVADVTLADVARLERTKQARERA